MLLVSGCEAGEGDVCEASAARCLGAGEALVCVEGTLVRLTCRGPDACAEGVCDQSVARVGDACAGTAACTEDRGSFLVCRDRRFAVGAACPDGCQIEGDRAVCARPELQPALQ
jgi:hypothetical protein